MRDGASVATTERRFDAAFRAEFADLLVWRRDVRRFRADPVPESTLDALFRLAEYSPSVGNCQPTRFVRVDDEGRRAAVRANFEAANREALGAYARPAGELYARLKLAGLSEAPVHCAVFCDEQTERGPRPRRAHHAGDAPLLGGLRPLHLLARRPRLRPRRRLGVDPRSDEPRRRRSTCRRTGPSSAISASAGRRRSTMFRNSSGPAGRRAPLIRCCEGDMRPSRLARPGPAS